jgi:hypothetical protein
MTFFDATIFTFSSFPSLCVCVYPPYQILNAWTNIYETWNVYHCTWTHLTVELHKSLPTICKSTCVSFLFVPRQRLDKYPLIVVRQWLEKKTVTEATNAHATITNCWTRRLLWGPCRIKERRRLVLPRTSWIKSGLKSLRALYFLLY